LNLELACIPSQRLEIDDLCAGATYSTTQYYIPEDLNLSIAVVRVTTLALTKLSIPSKYSMKKKRIAQSCGSGNIDIASGYVTNARPGPEINHPRRVSKLVTDKPLFR
jgi:hypothetical protein